MGIQVQRVPRIIRRVINYTAKTNARIRETIAIPSNDATPAKNWLIVQPDTPTSPTYMIIVHLIIKYVDLFDITPCSPPIGSGKTPKTNERASTAVTIPKKIVEFNKTKPGATPILLVN